MPDRSDDPSAASGPNRPKRERSTRYPGVSLSESLKLCESIDRLGLDGLTASDIASALGYKNIKTNTFSARLSAARQFGLLNLAGDGYGLTSLAREILHPVDPEALPRLYRQALFKPPLYAELAERLASKRVPEASILGNVLYHNYQIIASAKEAAAEAFLDSARFSGALGDDQVFHPNGPVANNHPPGHTGPPPPLPPHPTPGADPEAAPAAIVLPHSSSARPPSAPRADDVRLDLRLWDQDDGKSIRLRAPASISIASFERFLQAFRLLIRIDDASPTASDPID